MVQHDIIQCRELLANKVVGNLTWSNANGPKIFDEVSTATNPTICPQKDDDDSGLSRTTGDTPCIVAGAIMAQRWQETANQIIVASSANVGLTAHVGSAQGSGPILSTYNVYDTVAFAGDAATLPSAFLVGTIIYIKNGAATNSMDIFPASGDDLGEGANTVIPLAAKDFIVFIATTTDAAWEQLMTGTCVS